MTRHNKLKIPGASFSMKRALGISQAKRNFSRKTSIPTSKAGMQRKAGKAITGGGCLLPALSFAVVFIACMALLTSSVL